VATLYKNIRSFRDFDRNDIEQFFLKRPLLNGSGEFAVSRTNNMPEFSFATVSESESDGIPLCIKLLLPVVLPVLTQVRSSAKFSDYRPISLLVCLSKVFEVLMARQMERHIRCNNLLTVFQSGFRRHQTTAVVVLKVTEDIRLSMDDEHVTVLLLLNFS
jgi:small basic protein